MSRVYSSEKVHIADLVGDDGMLREVTLIDCDVVGPAVLAPLDGAEISGCNFAASGANELLWIIPEDRPSVVGAVGLLSSRLLNCRLHQIGLAIPAAGRAELLAGFGIDEQG